LKQFIIDVVNMNRMVVITGGSNGIGTEIDVDSGFSCMAI